MSASYAKPLPRIDPANRPFWDGLRSGKVMLQCCADCGAYRFPAARYCARCASDRSAWRETSGRGVVESFCTFHKAYWPSFAAEVPYDVVQVRTEEGVQFFSNLIGVAPGEVCIGTTVVAAFDAVTPEITLLKFRPVKEKA